ncbi:hypothetical protein PG989_002506 [Apiospora arundinis]
MILPSQGEAWQAKLGLNNKHECASRAPILRSAIVKFQAALHYAGNGGFGFGGSNIWHGT